MTFDMEVVGLVACELTDAYELLLCLKPWTSVVKFDVEILTPRLHSLNADRSDVEILVPDLLCPSSY